MPGHKSDYLEFGVKVGLDSKEAQKELQELQKQLNSLGTLSNPKVGDKLSADMQKASQAAAKLKVALDSAIDIDTGKLDLSKFSRSLKDSGMNLKQYRDQLMSMGPEGEKAFTQVANSVLKAEAPLRRTSKLIDTMWTTLKNTARWELSSSILRGLESSLQKAVTYAQDLNKSLTDIRIVTGYSTDHMAEFAVEANKAAKALSATTTEYTNASLIYFQQGLSDQQVKERTEVTVKMANATRDSAQVVSDQMTAVWNNFADGSHTLEYYADVMTALGAATASSTKEISDGLEKFAAVAETVGLSYEYAASALATITSNTRQSADVVGTALKTLFARIQGFSLGETLEDGTDLNKYSEALAKVGIQVKEQNGDLKAMDDILNEMADVWDKLNNDQQVALAQTVAGVRQYTQLVALMENWDNGDEDSMMANLNTSANATGALQEQADIYAESWEAARDRVTAALESIFNKLLKDEFFIDILNNIEKIITGIDKFIDSIGGLQGVLTGLGAIATKVFSSQISSGLSNLAYNLNFKQAQEDDKSMRKQAASLTASMYASSNSPLADSYKAIGELQEKIIENSNQLSDEQLEVLKYDLKRVEALQAQNAELEKQYQIVSQQVTNFESQDLIISKQHQLKEEDLQDLKTRYNYNKNTKEKYDKWKEKHPDLAGDKYKEERGKKWKEISDNELFDSISKAYQKDLADQASNQKQLNELNNKKLKLTEKLNKIKNSENQASEESQKKQEEINKEINKIDTEIDETHDNLEIINNSLNQTRADYQTLVGLDDDQMVQREEAYQGKSSLNEDITKADDAVQGYIKGIKEKAEQPKNIIKWVDSLTQAADGAMSLSFGLTQLSSAWDIIQDPDATAWEKWSNAILSVSTGLPMLITGFNSLTTGILKFIPTALLGATITKEDGIYQIKDAAGKVVNEKATGFLSRAQKALNGNFFTAFIALLPYIAALAGLAIVIYGLVKAYQVWKAEQPEEQLKKAKEETEHLTEATNQANEACQNLKNTISSYSEAKASLDTLTQGTEEFKAKLEEVNGFAKELIETLNLVYGSDYTIDSTTGEIIINDYENKLAEYEYQAEESVEASRAAQYISMNREKELENIIAYDNASKEVIDFMGYKNASKIGQTAYKGQNYNYEQPQIYEDTAEEYLKQTTNAIDNFTGGLNAFLVAENDELAKAIFDVQNYDDLNEDQRKYIDSIKENKDAFAELYTSIKDNNEAIKSNTRLLLQQSLENERFYQESDFKATIVAEAAEVFDKAYADKKAELDSKDTKEEDIFKEYAKIMGLTDTGEKNDDGDRIFKDKLGNEVTLTLEEIKQIIAGYYADQASEAQGQQTAENMAALKRTNPNAAAFIEQQNGGSKMDYSAQLDLSAQAQSYGTYENAKYAARYGDQNAAQLIQAGSELWNYNPYGDLEESVKTNYADSGFNEEQLQNQVEQAKTWWASLPEEDKKLAMSIDFSQGNWEEQLDTLKSDSLITEAASKYELDPDIIKTQAKAYQELYSEMELTEEAAVKMAIATQRAEKGVTTLSENWEDWKKTLESTDKTSTDYIKTITELTDVIADLTGQDDLELSQEFFDTAENIELLGKAAKGSGKDIAKLGVAVQKDLVKNLKLDKKTLGAMAKNNQALLKDVFSLEDLEKNCQEEFENIKSTVTSGMDLIYQAIEQGKFKAGTSLDDILGGADKKAEWVQAMNDIAIATGMSVQDMNEMLSGLHLDAEVSEKQVTVTSKVPVTETTTEVVGDETLPNGMPKTTRTTSKVVDYVDVEQEMMVAQLGVNGEAPGDVEITSLGTSNISPSASGSSGGGGGSGSSAEPLEYEDEIERYHENTRQLERLTRALEKVSKAKDRAFGKERLRLIDEEIAATEALVQQQRAYIAEAKQYLKQDFAEIQQYGFTTDQYGELTNYDEVMKQQIDKYNAAVATGNQDVIDAAKKQYDEFKENMEQYEETLTLYEEAQAQLQDYINQVVDLKLEKITTEVEIKLRVNDKELTKLEYLLKKIEYEGKDAADAIGLIGKQFEQVNQKAETVREAIDKIYKQAREEGRGFTDEEIAEAQALYEGGLTPEEEARLQEIHQKVIDEDRALTQMEEDQILEYQEMLLEYNSEVMDYVETVESKFIETFDELNGAVDETIGRFATYAGMLETLKDVITLTGKANTKYGKDLMSQFSARTVANASAAMRSNIASYNNLNKQYEAQQQSLARAIEAGDERFIQTQKEYLEHVELAREIAYEAMLTSWSDVLQASSDLFDARLDEMIFNLKQNLGDIDTLVEIYDRAVELEELYISGNKSIYELSKLARDIGKDIDATSNLIAKNKLIGLLEQINKLRAEGVKLSEYDLEYWQAKYELELAEIALQEAQEAKSQIKLTRNNAGGWGYMYTADAEAIAEAEQNYEDSLYNMQSIHEEYISDYSERFLKNQQEMADELHNIDKERADYEEEVMRVRDHYFKQQEYLMNELNKAYERSGIGFKDTILGQQSEFSTLEQYYQNFIDSSSEMIENEFIDSYKLWQQQVQDANNEMGKNLEDFAEDISNTSDTLEDKVISKIDEMGITMEETSNKIWDFQETYGAAIAEMIKANEEFFDKTAKDYNNFISETAIGEYLKNQEAFMSTGDVLGLTGKGGMGATGYGGLGAAGSASSALNGWLGSLNSATGRSGSKSSGSKNSIVLGDGSSEGVHLRADGTYSGIATISAGEERIPEAAMRALREDPALEGMNLSSYAGDDDSLSASELKKLFKDKNVNYSKYIEDYDDVQSFGITLATGGYTGSWGPDARWALLHEKELVLNKFDTENMLNMVNTLRDIDWRAKIAELWPAIEEKFIMPALNQAEELLQEVHIEANFPGVSDRNELEEAFHNLINTASQYANRKRY